MVVVDYVIDAVRVMIFRGGISCGRFIFPLLAFEDK